MRFEHRLRRRSFAARLDALEAALERQRASLERMEQTLLDVRRGIAGSGRHGEPTVRAQLALEALVRRLYLDPTDLPYPQRLTTQRFRLYSQNAEDGIVLALLAEAGTTTRRFVEIGCGFNGGNSGLLVQELGWSGLMVDANPDAVAAVQLRFGRDRVRTVCARVTRENVNGLVEENGVTGEVDVLSIDIDGNDIWVWEALRACSARIVIIEYNALFGPEASVAVPYDAEFAFEPGSSYFGASLAAIARMGEKTGYRLVATEPRGANAFLVRADVAPSVPAATPAAAYSPLLTPGLLVDHEPRPSRVAKLARRERDLDELIRERGLPLTEIA